jgi:DNA-binding response OmpR family regulator
VTACVLVVEDDPLIRSSLGRALRVNGYEVAAVGSLAESVEELASRAVDVVVCDLGLPDGDGLDLIEQLQATSPGLPVIVLTARSEEADVVAGLASGAVDYVTKPFRLAELLARIAAIVRFASARPASLPAQDVLTVGDLTIHRGARRVQLGQRELELRPREFDLLVRLALEPGVVVRRDDLMTDVWDEHWWGSTKTLDVHIHALRRQLGESAGDGGRITAVRGVGYRLEARKDA